MTAARREAEVVPCEDCEVPAGYPCVWLTGHPKKVPCLTRMKAAERYDGADPPEGANPTGFVRDGLTQLDSELSQRDITEPLHPQEDSDA